MPGVVFVIVVPTANFEQEILNGKNSKFHVMKEKSNSKTICEKIEEKTCAKHCVFIGIVFIFNPHRDATGNCDQFASHHWW